MSIYKEHIFPAINIHNKPQSDRDLNVDNIITDYQITSEKAKLLKP